MNYKKLRDETWAAAATRIIPLDTLDPGKRCRGIHMYFDLNGTKDAADALDGQLFANAVALIKIGNMVNIPGWHLQQLMHAMLGRVSQDPTDVPGSGTTFDTNFHLYVPFRDPRQPAADDGSIPTELLIGKALEIQFAAANVHGVGNLVLTAGTVRVQAELVDGSGIPQVAQIGYLDPGSQTIELDAGIYKDLFLTDGTGSGTITQAEIASVDVEADGRTVWNNALHEQVIGAYNLTGVRDAAGELTINAATRFPLAWHDQSGKSNLSKQMAVESKGVIRLTGTITAPRVVYWRTVAKDEVAVQKMAQATGAPASATSYEPATASKSVIRAFDKAARENGSNKKSRLLGSHLAGKVRTTPTGR